MDDTLRFLSIIDKKCNKVRKTKETGKKFPVSFVNNDLCFYYSSNKFLYMILELLDLILNKQVGNYKSTNECLLKQALKQWK